MMYNHVNPKNGEPAALIAEDVYKLIMEVRGLCSFSSWALLVSPG